jgi:pyruvate carboxylase
VSELSAEDSEALKASPRATLNRLLFPGPTRDFERSREAYSDLAVLGTREFLHGIEVGHEHQIDLEPGKRLLIGLQSVSDADERGLRTVMFTMGGQLRPIQVRDEKVAVDVKAAEKADPADKGQVAAPFAGVVSLSVAEGDAVEAGAAVATIEAMKMEASITTPVAGVVSRLAIGSQQQVEGGDLILVLRS